jgi:ATP-dependent DNA ligase
VFLKKGKAPFAERRISEKLWAGWLKRRLVATVEYLELTVANHLRHPKFSGCQAWVPKVPVLNQVVRESKSVRSVCTSATARGQAQPHGSVSG